MAERTIKVDMDPQTGKTLITIESPGRVIGRVGIFEEDLNEGTGARWVVTGADRKINRYGSLETAFRNAIMSAVDVVSEDLLPTRTR